MEGDGEMLIVVVFVILFGLGLYAVLPACMLSSTISQQQEKEGQGEDGG